MYVYVIQVVSSLWAFQSKFCANFSFLLLIYMLRLFLRTCFDDPDCLVKSMYRVPHYVIFASLLSFHSSYIHIFQYNALKHAQYMFFP
jgi:hypothetical protein